MSAENMLWIVFAGFVSVMLWLDLWVLQRKPHLVGMGEAVFWSVFWFLLALGFGGLVFAVRGPGPGVEFITAYLVERSLSIDNLFIFMLIFGYFRVPVQYQQKSLLWGILAALAMRSLFIVFGIALLNAFHFVIYIFGALLIFSAYKMVTEKDKKIDPGKNPVVKMLRRIVPMTDSYDRDRFFVKGPTGKRMATPMVAVLVAIAVFDVVFAVDSIPAVLGVTRDPFTVYTSNIFAMLGLRAMYFALAGFVGMFRYLSYGLAVVLAFIGGKLLLSDVYHFPIVWALAAVLGILALSVLASHLIPEKKAGPHGSPVTSTPPVGEGK